MPRLKTIGILLGGVLSASAPWAHDEVEPGTGGAGAPNGATSAADCVGGDAGGFPCSNVDLHARIPLLGFSTAPASASDVWGFLDLNTFREYALITLRNGTAVVDVTDPDHPHEIATIAGAQTTWRDVKVLQRWNGTRFDAYAYVTAEQVGERLTIIDLRGLPARVELAGRPGDFANAHNVYLAAIDYATGLEISGREALAIVAGSSADAGRFRAFSLADPAQPVLAATGTLAEYMHDATSLELDDARCAVPPCHILFDFNENNLLVWDVTSPGAPAHISTTSYPNLGYVHSGWWSEDRRHLFVHDELDEADFGFNTQVRVFDISDLNVPVLAGLWQGPTTAIDHNGMARGNRYYISNYTRGLTVLDITDPAAPVTVGQFDSYPSDDTTGFNGAWGVYPFLPSGSILISDVQGGLFVLDDGTLGSAAGELGFAAPASAAAEGFAAAIEVARANGAASDVTVDYELVEASAGTDDFTPARGTLAWGDGDTSAKTIAVSTTADAAAEPNEFLLLRLSNPTGGATLAVGRAMAPLHVYDAGTQASVGFQAADLTAVETHHGAFAVVERSGSLASAISVDVDVVAGSAEPGADYVEMATRTLSWAAGDGRPQTVTVELSNDGLDETLESFELQLSNAVDATIGAGVLTVQIKDVVNRRPLAAAGGNQTVAAGATVTLTSSSSDPDGDALAHSWQQTSGQNVALGDASRSSVSFRAPSFSGPLGFQLTVTDALGVSDSQSITVIVQGGGGGGGGSIGPGMLLAALLVMLMIKRPSAASRACASRAVAHARETAPHARC